MAGLRSEAGALRDPMSTLSDSNARASGGVEKQVQVHLDDEFGDDDAIESELDDRT